jgi:hypothetical protein
VIITRRVNFAAWVHSARQAGSLVEALQISSGNQPFQLIRAPGGVHYFSLPKSFVKFREKNVNCLVFFSSFPIVLYIYTLVAIFVFVCKFVGKIDDVSLTLLKFSLKIR